MSTALNESILLTKNWLLYSGIQNINKEPKLNGGFNSWYDIDKENYYYIYSEITGYGISTLLFLNKYFEEQALSERAETAADWIMNIAMHKLGGVKTRYYFYEADGQKNYSFDSEILYTFDTGMVLNGMINLYKPTKNKKYLDASIKIADFLINKMLKEDGSFYAYLDVKKNSLVDTEDKWSTQSGSYHSKLAIGLIDLYKSTNDEKYKDVAIKICDYALTFQTQEGRFISFRDSKNTHMHPHSYSAEGLLYAGIKLNIPRYKESSKKALLWALSNQLESGGVASLYIKSEDNFIKNERTDTLAQILRLGSLLIKYGLLDINYLKNLEKLKNRLISFQEKEGRQKGGFKYGFEEDGTKLDHLNSWCTMFAIQALILYNRISLKNQDIEMLI